MPLTVTEAEKIRLEVKAKRKNAGAGGQKYELESSPEVNALSFAIRHLPGGRMRFLELVKLAAMNGDGCAITWFRIYGELSEWKRKRVNFDDICFAASVRPSELLAAVVGHGVESQKDVGELVAAAFHPALVEASNKSALRITGKYAQIALEDRKAMLQARGFLPVPKGTSIYLNAQANSSSNSNAQAAAAASADPSVPKFAEDIGALSDPRAAVQRQLGDITEGETADS